MDVGRYQALKELVASLEKEQVRCEALLEREMKALREEFDCKSLDEANELLESLTEKKRKAENKFTKAIKQFEEKWSEVL